MIKCLCGEKKIDYNKWSKEELIKEIKRIKETEYGLVWHRDVPEEKIDILINPDADTPNEMFSNEVQGKPFPILKEIKNKGVVGKKGEQNNILIEGDNYHSLAVLNFTHRDSIDLIYIDPSYNTGNKDFIYTDKFDSDYVDKDDPFRHSKWLAFMEKRLKLSKTILKESGAIFISIDDHEQAPLKMLCDEVFGEKNFIGKIIIQSNPRGSQASKHLAVTHEYLLVYAKRSEKLVIDGFDKEESNVQEYSYSDQDGRKYRLLGSKSTISTIPLTTIPLTGEFSFITPVTGDICSELFSLFLIDEIIPPITTKNIIM